MSGCCFSNNKKSVKKTYYKETGAIRTTQEYINDRVFGVYKSYYRNGVLRDSCYKDGDIIKGYRKMYYVNGQLEVLAYYDNGIERDAVFYHYDGRLSSYKALSFSECVPFVINYDSLENYECLKGTTIYSWKIKDTVPVDSFFTIQLLIPTPPNCISILQVFDWDTEKETRLNLENKYVPNNNLVSLRRKHTSVFTTYIVNIANIRDTVRNITISDTLVHKIETSGATSYSYSLDSIEHSEKYWMTLPPHR